MFRRKRSSSNASTASNTTPAATTAAVQAFVKRQASDASLSSSAAAAALRSHATSPVPVGDIQTKRMMRRGSVSSVGSAATDVRPGLQRRGSSGSMTERSFRSPSPGGRPPVPKLPAKVPPIPVKSHRRSASQEAPPLRVTSPTPADGARGVSMDRGTASSNRRVPARPQSLAQVLEQPDQPKTKVVYNPETRKLETRTIYPPPKASGDPQQQPINRSTKAGNGPWHLGAVTSGAEPRGGWAGDPTTPSTPTANNKKKLVRAADGPSSTSGGVGPGFAGQAYDAPLSPALRPTSPAMSDVSLSPGTAKKRTQFSKEARGLPLRPASVASQRAVATAQTQKDKAEAASVAQRKAAAMLARPLSSYAPISEAPVVPPTSNPKPKQKPVTTAPSSTDKQSQQLNSTAPVSTAPKTDKLTPTKAGIATLDSAHLATPSQAQPVRTASVSPARSAHFSETPVVAAVKHAPPPRSISPVKSALKSHSPRRASPSPNSKLTAPESVDGSNASDDGISLSSKRRSVRVSFEETAVAIGEAATPTSSDSPMIASPQTSRFPAKALLPSQLQDETMGTRPLLPSFGSIRAQRDRSPAASQSLEDSSLAEAFSNLLPSSSDHGIGSVIAQTEAHQDDHESASHTTEAVHAPAISIVPATPHPEDEKQLQPPASGNDATVPMASSEEDSKDSKIQKQGTKAVTERDSGDYSIPNPAANVSEVAKKTNTEVAKDDSTEGDDWDQVRAYWTSLSETKKREIEQEALKSGLQGPLLPPWPDQQYQQSVLREARGDGGEKALRKSMRDDTEAQRAKPANGSASNNLPTGPKGATKPQLRRTGSDDSSASESSFKRARGRARAKNNINNDSGRYTMRASMRDGTVPQLETAVGGRARANPGHTKSLRSGRPSSMDGGNPGKESGGFFGLGKSKAKNVKASTKPSRFQSRFADSSDEDEPSTNWRSRFADSDNSSDEEVRGIKLTPVRGIPKRAGRDEGDSTELDDSDEDDGNRAATARARKGVASDGNAYATNREMPSTMRAPGTPDGKKSKRGLFGLGKKKQQDADIGTTVMSSTGALSAAAAAAASEGVENTPASPSNIGTSKLSKGLRSESSTRRPNSILRRFSSPTAPPMVSQGVNAQNFPFPVPPIPDEHKQGNYPMGSDRPNTSDGFSEARSRSRPAPTMRDKRQSAVVTGAGSNARVSDNIKPVIVSARTGKPKKFQGLRRVFGMTD